MPGEMMENKYPIEVQDFGNLHADAVRLAQDDPDKDTEADADTDGDEDTDTDLAGAAGASETGDENDGDGNVDGEEEDLAGAAGMEDPKTDTVEGDEPTAPGKKWFKAINAQTLDSVITEMNEMNRWFAKVESFDK